MHVRRDDVVQVIAGDDAGKTGRILKVLSDKNRVVVEGINYIFKHVRRSQKQPQGGRVQKESPIAVSNVMLMCQNKSCKRFEKTVRIRQRTLPDGTKARVCVKCNEPVGATE
ncbi:MAG: 50S ribosomal protein L24 [Planctomycetes bacterium]|nr:50S ribosomal protein L24 [Planctomycetota bacterium]MBM4078476.1 50S ribosomal protein L24 [Planctomycetota bacterium]MBM4083180.1 50S ribosomal protein L24 [Planctomycetota bacterium]